MRPATEALALIAFGALCVVGIIVCAVTSVTIPTALTDLALVGVSAGAGNAYPSRTVANTPAP